VSGDAINGAIELVGALFTWRSLLQLWRDREVKGVYWPATAFWAVWGIWNLYYYPSLGQWLSFCAGAFLVLGNVCWLALVVRLRLPGAP
jgi:hypothetical protein